MRFEFQQVFFQTDALEDFFQQRRKDRSKRRDHPELRGVGERCVVGFGSSGGPPMMNVLYNNHYQIVQSPG